MSWNTDSVMRKPAVMLISVNDDSCLNAVELVDFDPFTLIICVNITFLQSVLDHWQNIYFIYSFRM